MTVFFTSDSHFSHDRIIKYCRRPFKNGFEMDDVLIDNWNKVVTKNDVVYHLGDYGFTPKAKTEGIERLQKISNRLRGKIILIKGNHDTNVDKINRFETVKDYHVIHTHNTRFVLFHYPMRSWQFMNHGSIHLFGHCHSNMPPHYQSFDVGVDNVAKIFGLGRPEDYRPINVHEVLDYARTLQKQPWAM